MNTTALIRSIPFWLLLVLSLAAIGVGGWIATDQIGVMTATLMDGTATGVEVYAGQSWVVVGGALIAGGVIGLFLVLALGAARTLLPRPAVEVVEAIDWSAQRADAAGATVGEEAGADRQSPSSDAETPQAETLPTETGEADAETLPAATEKREPAATDTADAERTRVTD